MSAVVIIAVVVLLAFLYKAFSQQKHEAFESVDSITSIFNHGFSISGGLRAIPRDVAYKNALVIGPSGSGKTSTVLIGTLHAIARGNSSAVVLDVSGEIYKLMSGYLSTKCKIYCIDFTPLSDGFNPLHCCKNVSDIQKIAGILMRNSGTESKSDPYWSSSAEKLISLFLEYLITYEKPEHHSLYNLVRMIEVFAGEPKKIDTWFAKAHSDMLTSYKALIAVGDKTLQSTISSALVALKIFKNPEVARCSAQSTFDFEHFRKEKSILFINTPISDINFLAPYSALLFEQLFKVVLSRIPTDDECAVFAILDEMVTMRFQNLGMIYSNIRKYKGGCMGVIQDERMLEMNYAAAEAHAIRTNSFSKIYLPGQPHQTCKLLEEIIGKDEHNKSVMAASQIRQLEEAIILCGNKKPFKEKMIPYFEHWLLSGRAKYPPYIQKRKIEFDTPSILEF